MSVQASWANHMDRKGTEGLNRDGVGILAAARTIRLCAYYRPVVEIDLQVKSMTPGKKGFQRLVQASKNALVTPTTWMVLGTTSGEY